METRPGPRSLRIHEHPGRGTPLATGRTPEEQADALAALLDALDIERVAVTAASGGGPSTYLLAARHPHRVTCLLEISSVCLPYRSHESPIQQRLEWSRAGLWIGRLLLDHFPNLAVRSVLGAASSLDRDEIAEQAQHIVTDPSRMAFPRLLWAMASHRLAERQQGRTTTTSRWPP